MAEFTLAQQKALALANARKRMAEEQGMDTAADPGMVERAKTELRRRRAMAELERRVPDHVDGGGSKTFLITAPNGKKYRVTGADAEGATKALQQHLSNAPDDDSGFMSYLKQAGDLASYANPGTAAGRWLAENVARDLSDAPKKDSRDNTLGKIDSFVRGAADTLSFGFADELAAGGDTLVTGDSYEKNLAQERATDTADYENRFKERLGGQITGGVSQGIGLAKNGLSATANAVRDGAPLLKTMLLGGAEGATLGAAHGLGSGEGLDDRIRQAWKGGLIGFGLGSTIPGVISGGKAVWDRVAAPFSPEGAKDRVLQALLRRANMSADDVVSRLQSAQDDGQSMFTAADALEHTGERMMSTAARTPGDGRKAVVNALMSRQTSQGERLSQYLAEGFDASETAAQRTSRLTQARNDAANSDYGALREQLGDTPIWGDDLQRLTSRPSVRRAINEVGDIAAERGYRVTNPFQTAQDGTLALPEGTAPNFTFWDTVKRGLDRQIATDPTNRDLVSTKAALTRILDDMVPNYASARQPFADASRSIDAIETGRLASSPRVRSEDSIDTFSAMSPDEQASFRFGYADPLIAKIDSASSSPTTNKARQLISAKSAEEFPAFAVPDRADQMLNRIAREQRMFETSNAALGGSKTQDNMADAADSVLDPGIIAALARGSVKDAMMSAVTQAANATRGLPPRVIERLIPVLMETNPQTVGELFSSSARTVADSASARARIIAALLGASGGVPGTAP